MRILPFREECWTVLGSCPDCSRPSLTALRGHFHRRVTGAQPWSQGKDSPSPKHPDPRGLTAQCSLVPSVNSDGGWGGAMQPLCSSYLPDSHTDPQGPCRSSSEVPLAVTPPWPNPRLAPQPSDPQQKLLLCRLSHLSSSGPSFLHLVSQEKNR